MRSGLPAIAVNPDHEERAVELVAYVDVYKEVSGLEVEIESIQVDGLLTFFFHSGKRLHSAFVRVLAS